MGQASGDNSMIVSNTAEGYFESSENRMGFVEDRVVESKSDSTETVPFGQLAHADHLSWCLLSTSGP